MSHISTKLEIKINFYGHVAQPSSAVSEVFMHTQCTPRYVTAQLELWNFGRCVRIQIDTQHVQSDTLGLCL